MSTPTSRRVAPAPATCKAGDLMVKGTFTLPLRHLATGIDVPSRVATNINGRDLPVELELFCEVSPCDWF